MPLHIAITRRVRPGREAEFQEALRHFLKASFDHSAVMGANMIVPAPDAKVCEFGILRTFRDEADRDAFYASELYQAWEERARPLTEGEPEHRVLHGLEAWFRAPGAPPRWKMALITFVGVYPLTSFLPSFVGRQLRSWHPLAVNVVVTGLIVLLLSWVIMPVLTRVFRPWLVAKK